MEDVSTILIFVGIIVVAIIQRIRKNPGKESTGQPDMPFGGMDNPLPENWGGNTYGGFIPEGPEPEVFIPQGKKKKHQPAKDRTSAGRNTVNQSSSNIGSQPIQQMPPPEVEQEEPSEFQINSAEEARRAIVWSEILQRKY